MRGVEMEVLAPDFFDAAWFAIQKVRFPVEVSEMQAKAVWDLLELRSGDAVLDVPIGTGRIALPLARRGAVLTGVDLYEEVLSEAVQAFAAEGLELRSHRADMRALPDGPFDAVVNMWGSFGYFGDAGDQAFAEAAARVLSPGGRLLIEGPGLEAMASMWRTDRFVRVGDHRLGEEMRYDPYTGQTMSTWTFLIDGAVHTREFRIRVYSGPEMVRMLRAAGFVDVQLYGDLHGAPYGIGAERMVVVALR